MPDTPPPMMATSMSGDDDDDEEVDEDTCLAMYLLLVAAPRRRAWWFRREIRIDAVPIDRGDDHLRPPLVVRLVQHRRHDRFHLRRAVDVIRVRAEPFRELHQIGLSQSIEVAPDVVRTGIEILHALADHVQIVIL